MDEEVYKAIWEGIPDSDDILEIIQSGVHAGVAEGFYPHDIEAAIKEAVENSFPSKGEILEAITEGIARSMPFARDIENAIYEGHKNR